MLESEMFLLARQPAAFDVNESRKRASLIMFHELALFVCHFIAELDDNARRRRGRK